MPDKQHQRRSSQHHPRWAIARIWSGIGALLALIALAPAAGAAPTPAAGNSTAAAGASSSAGDGGASRATFGVGPATLGKVDPRGYFSYQMGVGGIYNDHAAVLNYGTKPLALTVFAADFGNASNGSVQIGLQDQRLSDAGGWIALPAKNLLVTVPARTKSGPGRVVVPFRIAVPANASPGDHGAAIVAVLSTIGKNPKGENVRLDQRLASRVYLRVKGPLHPGLQVDGLTVSYHGSMNPIAGGAATVRYSVHNVGNVRLAAKQQVEVTGLFGTKSKVVGPADVQLLFPGSSEQVSVRVTGVFPALLEKSRVTVTPQLFSDQQPMAVPEATATKNFQAIPWALLASVALLFLVIALGWLLRRQARRRPQRHRRHGGSARLAVLPN